MSNKFAEALKRPEPPRQPDPEAAAGGSRAGRKHIGGYFAPEVSRQLRELALAEDSTVQALMGEALDLLFQARRLPTIAQR